MLRPAQTDRLFHALADATRRDIVRRAMAEAHSISSLASHYPMSFAAVQKHVAVLERAGLVSKERRGRERLIRADVERLRAGSRALDELESLWRGRVERMDAILTADDDATDTTTNDGAEPCP